MDTNESRSREHQQWYRFWLVALALSPFYLMLYFASEAIRGDYQRKLDSREARIELENKLFRAKWFKD